MTGGVSIWDGFNTLAYNLVAIPLLAAALFVVAIIPRALLKSHLSGVSLLVPSLALSFAALCLLTWAIGRALPEIDLAASLVRLCAAALLLAAWLVPRELDA